MNISERFAHFLEPFDKKTAQEIREQSRDIRARAQDISLQRALQQYGEAVVHAIEANDIRLELKAKHIQSLFISMLNEVRRHPAYQDVIALQVSETEAVILDGRVLPLEAVQAHGRVLTLLELRDLVLERR